MTTHPRIQQLCTELENDFFFPKPHSEYSVLIQYPKKGPGLLLSAAKDRDLRRVYCESSLYYPSGAIGSYEGMPDVLYTLEETRREIYRFYFLKYCLPQVLSMFPLYFIPRRKKVLSLHTLSLTTLSTSEMRDIREHFCLPQQRATECIG